MIRDLKPYPNYKDSGPPWLERVPATWRVMRGKHVFRIVDVRSQTGEEELLTVSSNDGVVPRSQKTVTMFKAESYVGHKLCWPGDLVINSLWAWMQGLGFARHHGLVSSAYSVYRPQEEFRDYARYFHYSLRSAAYKWELLTRSKGVWLSRLQLSDAAFLDIPILVPPRPEQSAIVRYLDWADRRIRRVLRARQQRIKLLEEYKQALIHHAVTGQIDVRTGQPYRAYKPSAIEWLREMPEHWEARKLHQLTDQRRPIMYGIVLPGPDVNEGVYIVKGGNCEPGRLRPEFMARTTFEIEARYGRSRLQRDDLVFAIRGGVGATELVSAELEGANLTQDAARVSPGPFAKPRWLLHTLRSRVVRNQVESRILGATITGINIRDLKRVKLPTPPAEEQFAIADFLDGHIDRVDRVNSSDQREIDLLKEFRTRLIADVVTGKLDVRAATTSLSDEAADLEAFNDAGTLLEGNDVDEAPLNGTETAEVGP